MTDHGKAQADELVEKVAKEIYGCEYDPRYMYQKRTAREAIRVVVEACAVVCSIHHNVYKKDEDVSEWAKGYRRASTGIRCDIRALAPHGGPEVGDGEKQSTNKENA